VRHCRDRRDREETVLKFFAAALAATIAVPAYAADVTMRMSHQLPPTHYVAVALEDWGKEIEKATGDTIDVQIFPASQAFKPEQVFPAVARGEIEVGMTTTFQWGNTLPEMNALTIPYLPNTTEKARKLAGSPAAALLKEKMRNLGVQNIAWLFMGNANFYTSNEKPLINVEDFKGLKMRGLSKISDAGLSAAGASPVTMPASELYQALQTGIVNGAAGDYLGAYARKLHEVQKFGTVAAASAVFNHIFVNPDWWDGLSDEQRKAITEATARLQDSMVEKNEAVVAKANADLESAMNVHHQTEAEAKAWADVMRPPSEKVFLQSTPGGQKLIDLLADL